MTEAGIVAAARYLPWFRLTAQELARSQRRADPRRPQQRRLAGYDEDALTMAVGAARLLPADILEQVDRVVFTSTNPPYLIKNNASVAHAALGLIEQVGAFDLGGALRSSVGVVALTGPGTLLLMADVNTARPGAPAELGHGDAAAALVLGPAANAIAELVDSVSVTEELLDQWRLDGQSWASTSEERFPVSRYGPLLDSLLSRLPTGGRPEGRFDHVVISASSPRVAAMAAKRTAGLGKLHVDTTVGFAGAADLAVQLSAVLETASPGDRILAISLADGCDALMFRCTKLLAERRPATNRATDGDDGATPTYLDALSWRGLLGREPPRRPEPAPVSPAVSARRVGWKYGLQGSVCGSCRSIATPPQRVCVRCGSLDTGGRVDLSRRPATISTFSVDRLAYSPNPPMVAAIVDFDGGGRMEVEMTDARPEDLAVGQRVEMTFRLRHSSGGIHNYAWKALPQRGDNDA